VAGRHEAVASGRGADMTGALRRRFVELAPRWGSDRPTPRRFEYADPSRTGSG